MQDAGAGAGCSASPAAASEGEGSPKSAVRGRVTRARNPRPKKPRCNIMPAAFRLRIDGAESEVTVSWTRWSRFRAAFMRPQLAGGLNLAIIPTSEMFDGH